MERAEKYRMQRAAYGAQIKASQAHEAYRKKRMETEFPTTDTNSRNNYSACSPPHESTVLFRFKESFYQLPILPIYQFEYIWVEKRRRCIYIVSY